MGYVRIFIENIEVIQKLLHTFGQLYFRSNVKTFYMPLDFG